MTAVDFSLLREITDGDKETEAALFSLFIETAEETLVSLRDNLNGGEMWKKQAHAFKGSSANLGATRLSELCREAQGMPDSPREDRERILQSIEDEFKLVRTCMEQELSNA